MCSLRWNVRRGMPILLAASVRLPSVSFKARMINCFSASLTVKSLLASTCAESPGGPASERTVRGRSRAEMRSPRHNTTALSIAVRSSRTFGPAMVHQQFQGIGREILHWFMILFGKLAQKALSEQGNILRSLAQRW